MSHLSYSAGLTASLLLLASSPAMAGERGGGAGAADDSGATQATSGREGTGHGARPSDTAMENDQPVDKELGVRPDSDRQGRRPQHRRSEEAGATTPAPAPAEDEPETTGGGR
jgi:hypothetical protein